mgnify:CR=1 FL=1
MDIEKWNWFAQHVAQLHRAAESQDVEEGMNFYSGLVGEYLTFFPGSVFNEDFSTYLRAGGIYKKSGDTK